MYTDYKQKQERNQWFYHGNVHVVTNNGRRITENPQANYIYKKRPSSRNKQAKGSMKINSQNEGLR